MAPVHRSLAPQVGSLFVRASCILFSWPWLQEPLPSNILLLESLLKVTQVRVSVSGSRRFQLETGSRGGGQERAGPQAERVVRQKGSKQGLDTAAQRGLIWLHLGAGMGGASGQRKPEEVGTQTGLQSRQQKMGL